MAGLEPIRGWGRRSPAGRPARASVRAGLEALAGEAPDAVLIHDAARPFVAGEVVAAS